MTQFSETLTKATTSNPTATLVSLPWHPWLMEAQPYLEKITVEEWCYTIGGIICSIIVIYLGLAMMATKIGRRELTSWTVFWLVLSAVIHSYLELHFVFFRETSWIANSMDLYAAADFRYRRPLLEEGTAAMEAITAIFDGPFCILIAYGIVTQKFWRHPCQIILSTCHLYGLAWFTLHTAFSSIPVASSDPFLFWVVFVGLNAPWSIFPFILLCKSVNYIVTQLRIAAAIPTQSNQKKVQ
jgi:cholestenol delta-isomerase